MVLTIRINGTLSQEIGSTRIQVDLQENATVNDLISQLAVRYPLAEATLQNAIPFAAGKHLSPETVLTSTTQLALLMPIAGG